MIEIKDSKSYHSDKIKSEKEIIAIVSDLKKQGKKVGLCVGGFDLLHPGHMTHLRFAKKLCDFLVIGVTSDKFNAQRKGDGRPIYNDLLRTFSLSQLESVDFVFVSNYYLAIEVIGAIKPSFYIKGPDYIGKSDSEIDAERQEIKRVGGDIKYTWDEKLATTEIIRYIQGEVKKV